MFNDTLVESSRALRKRNRWPMATAFITQIFVAAALLIVPLFTIGMVPVAPHVSLFTQLTEPPVVEAAAKTSGGRGGTAYSNQVVVVPATRSLIVYSLHQNNTDDIRPIPRIGDGIQPSSFPFGSGPGPGTGPAVRLADDTKPHRVSHMDEGSLIRKVLPVYPALASRINVQGDVKLHAIISRDGSIESLNVISGHPLLVGAAIDAVRQWKYRPYILNREPVEVETFITVTFKRGN